MDQDQTPDLYQVQGLVTTEIEVGAIYVGNMTILLENALMLQWMRNQTTVTRNKQPYNIAYKY